MPRIANGLIVSIPAGRALAVAAIPVDDVASILRVTVKRCTTVNPLRWPNVETRVFFEAQVSYDNQATWETVTGGLAEGGIATDRFGVELVDQLFEGTLRAGTNRMMRVFLTVENGPLVSDVTVATR